MTALDNLHPWLCQLRPYQVDGARWLQQMPTATARGRLLGLSPGLGKTAISIAALRIRYDLGQLDSVIPVVTTAIARGDWVREVKQWWPEAQCHIMRVDDDEAHHRWESKDDFTKRRQMTWRDAFNYKGTRPLFLISSYESARDLHEVAVEDNLVFDTLVMDECHNAKRQRNLTSVLLRVLVGKARQVHLITATAVHNRPADLFNLLNIMDPAKFPNYMGFVQRFFMTRVSAGGWGYTVDELLDKPGLTAACAPYVYTIPAEVALGNLPARQRTLRRIPVKEAVRLSPAKLNGLRKYSGLDNALRAMVFHKMKVAVQLIQDLDEPVVAYTYRRVDASTLHERLVKLGITATLATGDTTTEKRTRLIEEWKAGSTKVLVATMDAVRESATLTRAAVMIFLDLDWLPGKMIQLEGRIDPSRQPEGERRPARYIYLVVENGPDEVVAERVIEKIEEAQGVVGSSSSTESLKELLRPLKKEVLEISPKTMLDDLVERLTARANRLEELGLNEPAPWET